MMVELRWFSPRHPRRKLQIDAAQRLETPPDRLNETARRFRLRLRLIEGQRLFKDSTCLGFDQPTMVRGTDTEGFLQAWIERPDVQ